MKNGKNGHENHDGKNGKCSNGEGARRKRLPRKMRLIVVQESGGMKRFKFTVSKCSRNFAKKEFKMMFDLPPRACVSAFAIPLADAESHLLSFLIKTKNMEWLRRLIVEVSSKAVHPLSE